MKLRKKRVPDPLLLLLAHAAALAAKVGAQLTVAHIDEAPPGNGGLDSLRRLYDWIPASVRAQCAVKEVGEKGVRYPFSVR